LKILNNAYHFGCEISEIDHEEIVLFDLIRDLEKENGWVKVSELNDRIQKEERT
jgi:hypothetical protein